MEAKQTRAKTLPRKDGKPVKAGGSSGATKGQSVKVPSGVSLWTLPVRWAPMRAPPSSPTAGLTCYEVSDEGSASLPRSALVWPSL